MVTSRHSHGLLSGQARTEILIPVCEKLGLPLCRERLVRGCLEKGTSSESTGLRTHRAAIQYTKLPTHGSREARARSGYQTLLCRVSPALSILRRSPCCSVVAQTREADL